MLNVDQSGSILGVSLSSAIPYCQGLPPENVENSRFNTNVEVIQTSAGPRYTQLIFTILHAILSV